MRGLLKLLDLRVESKRVGGFDVFFEAPRCGSLEVGCVVFQIGLHSCAWSCSGSALVIQPTLSKSLSAVTILFTPSLSITATWRAS